MIDNKDSIKDIEIEIIRVINSLSKARIDLELIFAKMKNIATDETIKSVAKAEDNICQAMATLYYDTYIKMEAK